MTTDAPTRYELIKCPLGKYVWWPHIQLVDFIPKGRHKPIKIFNLSTKENNELKALHVASIDLLKRTRDILVEKKIEAADKRLKEEMSGATSSWKE